MSPPIASTLGLLADPLPATAIPSAPAATPKAAGTTAGRRPDPALWLAATLLLALALAALAPAALSPHDPLEGDFLAVLQPPSLDHPFGTDRLGRDVLARTLHGAQHSLLIGLGATGLALVAGVLLGLLAGRGQRWLDELVTRLFDVLSSFPGVLLAMLVVVFLGPSLVNVAVAVGLAGVPKFGRVVRAQALLVREADYVRHAVIYGRGRWHVFSRHLLPNVLVAVPVTATVSVGTAILAASGLSFLGLGPQPPTPEWGVMLAEARDTLRVAWWPAVFPGAAITGTVAAISVLGNRLQLRFERRGPA